MLSLPSDVDVLVIGAGPAGTSAAALLHKAGLRPLIVERETFPRFQIGESLLPRSMETLEEAGLLEALRARGYIIKRGATFVRGDERAVFDFSEAHTPGWTWTWQVPRADFDHTLARACEARGVPVAWRHEVAGFTPAAQGYDPTGREGGPVTTIRTPEGEERQVRSRWVVDASGYGRVLPRLLGLDRPSGQALRRAVFAHVTGDRRPPGDDGGRIWISLHPGGAWIWVIPFSDGVTSVGVVAPEAFWEGLPDDREAAFRQALQGDPGAWPRLADVRLVWPPRELRGYSSTASRVHGPGFCLVGNATEFLDPVFSSGVTLALESSRMASRAIVDALAGRAVDWDAAYAEPLARGVEVFRTYVDTWYDGTLPQLFFAADQEGIFKPQLCSVLAGYVWDESNPFVRHHRRRVRQAARMVARSEGTLEP